MLDLFLDEFGVQFEDGSFDPDSVIVIEGPNHAPQINVGLDLQGRSLEFGELDFFSHLQSEDIMVDDFLGFFEVGNPGQQLIDFSIGIVFLKTFGKLFQFLDFVEQVSDICVELLDHAVDRFFQLGSFFFDSLLLG